MSNRDAIIEKIKKLLKLSENNTSENEAISAALKAQKLISEYDVSEEEYIDNCKSTQIITLTSEEYSGKQWRLFIASVVAKNFRCTCFQTPLRKSCNNYKRTNTISFVGYEHDAKAAVLVYTKLINVGEQKASEISKLAKKQFGTSQGVKPSYYKGFIAGVDNELSKQCQALMLVVPQEVQSQMDNYAFKSVKFESTSNIIDASTTGYRDGKYSIRSSRIEAMDESSLLEN